MYNVRCLKNLVVGSKKYIPMCGFELLVRRWHHWAVSATYRRQMALHVRKTRN